MADPKNSFRGNSGFLVFESYSTTSERIQHRAFNFPATVLSTVDSSFEPASMEMDPSA
ncbi:hypothetical protein CfE428DRAFT_5009 [Chthoniobacter flavus Ellin428]|uniref:Uncharacterized protein n=1 Tax=Chthoniobacter flavus Ellin428 TaxID=497964 RepID=B4D7W9_9BACT|nr:hypothetical protein CfE428DRAFT_5009 [Chthoniobacter flavus Ellin428]